MEKQYPQFADDFSATTLSSRSQSISRGDGTTNVASDVSRNGTVDELDESLAEISATTDRLLRLAPFLEQYLHELDDDNGRISRGSISGPINRETNIYCDRILTRFPQASHDHVRIIANSRQRLRSVDSSGEKQQFSRINKCDRRFSPHTSSDPDVVHLLSIFEQAILEDKEVPYPAQPQDEHGGPVCNVCASKFPADLSVQEWRYVFRLQHVYSYAI